MAEANTPLIVVWFRQDLRLADHPALSAAVAAGAPVLPVFVLDESGDWAPGGASRWWLHGSLAALDADLRARGSRLLLRRGPALDVLPRLLAEAGAGGLYFSRHYEPQQAASESRLAAMLAADGKDCRRFAGSLLFEPEAIRTRAGEPFRVFTPFYKACLAANEIRAPLPAPDSVPAPASWPVGERLEDWGLRPSAPDWAAGLRACWQPGSSGARARLDGFLADVAADYAVARDRPDRAGTSKLSPHLHFGELSPRQVWQRSTFDSDAGRGGEGTQAFLRQVIWREFCYHLLHHWPEIDAKPFNPGFAGFPWRDDPAALAAWQGGRTGYPIVDAGMRQLWQTGWMHNRVRMVVASFLTKHLLLPWQAGADWFWDTLVDADLANNAAGWQWVAGCGADAAPYFRIFNPVLQGRKFDPDGSYVRRWVPELAEVPTRIVHAPWEAGAEVPGYPAPIVEHRHARQRALDAYAVLKRRSMAAPAPL